MQGFHYGYIKNKYSDKAGMLLADVDGCMYKIETENVHDYLYKDKELLFNSSYPKDSKYYSSTKNLVVGKMNDGTSDMPIKSFIEYKSEK